MANEVWGLLGDLQFEARSAPDTLSFSESQAFAELPLIQSKPVVQWVGTDLREIRMSFFFSYSWCRPSEKLKELQEILAAHEPLAFSLGEGRYNGNYVLVSIDGTVGKTLPSGELLELGVRVSLLETTDEPIEGEQGAIIQVSPFEVVR